MLPHYAQMRPRCVQTTDGIIHQRGDHVTEICMAWQSLTRLMPPSCTSIWSWGPSRWNLAQATFYTLHLSLTALPTAYNTTATTLLLSAYTHNILDLIYTSTTPPATTTMQAMKTIQSWLKTMKKTMKGNRAGGQLAPPVTLAESSRLSDRKASEKTSGSQLAPARVDEPAGCGRVSTRNATEEATGGQLALVMTPARFGQFQRELHPEHMGYEATPAPSFLPSSVSSYWDEWDDSESDSGSDDSSSMFSLETPDTSPLPSDAASSLSPSHRQMLIGECVWW
ncbi:hypothetical protein FRC11_006376 [Ceratobasidium sp. 423]|nr:hypothetical protein FRC11_006376 [Ceratobasidium sp. 423]